jgi:hypothetical protein
MNHNIAQETLPKIIKKWLNLGQKLFNFNFIYTF